MASLCQRLECGTLPGRGAAFGELADVGGAAPRLQCKQGNQRLRRCLKDAQGSQVALASVLMMKSTELSARPVCILGHAVASPH
jgi:hypothetical protein